jgi:hypothetical protein
MAIEQVKLGRFASWAQGLDDRGIIVLASFYGYWLDANNDIDVRNQLLLEIVAHDTELPRRAFKKWFGWYVGGDDKKTYQAARRQARRCYDSGEAFADAERKMISELLYEIFALDNED